MASATDIKNAFDSFDDDQTGSLNQTDAVLALRSLGKNPMEDELRDYLEGYGTVFFNVFLMFFCFFYLFTQDRIKDLRVFFCISDVYDFSVPFGSTSVIQLDYHISVYVSEHVY
eukprot:TRINITY_DN1081_c0_g1_i2.p1 TRINITY_DN1081_c0_g1~~TRINITY_DN1081_c0_g1_i2.p1  ORF type:complete len:114 (-),score=11.11 TRINITY_DN1081_c0_g1_i2:347-688(-)